MQCSRRATVENKYCLGLSTPDVTRALKSERLLLEGSVSRRHLSLFSYLHPTTHGIVADKVMYRTLNPNDVSSILTDPTEEV